MIRAKSVHSPIDRKADGLRILASRFRGRGLPASRYDVWMPNLGPSEALLRAFLRGEMSWAAFAARYRRELREDGGVDRRNAQIKNHGQKFTLRLIQELARRQPVTVMCVCAEEEKHCHRFELKRMLSNRIA